MVSCTAASRALLALDRLVDRCPRLDTGHPHQHDRRAAESKRPSEVGEAGAGIVGRPHFVNDNLSESRRASALDGKHGAPAVDVGVVTAGLAFHCLNLNVCSSVSKASTGAATSDLHQTPSTALTDVGVLVVIEMLRRLLGALAGMLRR